jgi:hypothetical protein
MRPVVTLIERYPLTAFFVGDGFPYSPKDVQSHRPTSNRKVGKQRERQADILKC